MAIKWLSLNSIRHVASDYAFVLAVFVNFICVFLPVAMVCTAVVSNSFVLCEGIPSYFAKVYFSCHKLVQFDTSQIMLILCGWEVDFWSLYHIELQNQWYGYGHALHAYNTLVTVPVQLVV